MRPWEVQEKATPKLPEGFGRDDLKLSQLLSADDWTDFSASSNWKSWQGGEIEPNISARFRAEIADILALCLELGGPGSTRSIWGEVPSKDYGQAVEDFQTDPQVRLFVAQIQAAGAGITLHAAHTAIFYSLDYSYLNYDQAKARIHRIGQRQPCTYIHLVAKDTIDEEVLAALAAKKNIAEDIVDNWRRVFAAP